MRYLIYEIDLTEGSDGWWSASVPAIPHIHCNGRSLKETKELVRNAIQLALEEQRETNRSMLLRSETADLKCVN